MASPAARAKVELQHKVGFETGDPRFGPVMIHPDPATAARANELDLTMGIHLSNAHGVECSANADRGFISPARHGFESVASVRER